MKEIFMRWLRSGLSLLLVLCMIFCTPVMSKAVCEDRPGAEATVTEAVDYCYKAQQIVDLIVAYVIDGEYASLFKGSETSSALKSMAIDMVIDELNNHEDLMIDFGFEPTDENKELVAEEIYDAACMYYDEMHSEGGSRESANKVSVIELIRFALVETRGYSEADAVDTAKFWYDINEINAANGTDAAIDFVLDSTDTEHNFVDGICTVCGETAVTRLSGNGRVETAIAVADQIKEVLGLEAFSTVIIANGDNFADALAGSYLATVKDAPILLHRNSGAGDELNLAYIQENLVANGLVYILGGTAAIPESLEDSLNDLKYNVVRLSGDSRFDTNLKILEAAGIDEEEILICTGWNYADSLSVSATGLPMLMLNTVTNDMTDNQIAFLEKYADNPFTIIGGVGAVSDELEAAVEAIVGEVDRVSGNTREETSVEVARRYFTAPEYAVVAYSRNFPDGLCGGPLANALNAPLLLANAGMEAAPAAYVTEHGVDNGFVLGGKAALSNESVAIIFANN